MRNQSATRKRSKRGNGDGSFYRAKDGDWILQITIDKCGKRKSFKAATQAECKQRRKEWEDAQVIKAQATFQPYLDESTQYCDHSKESEILFREAFPKWLELHKAPPTRKSSTYSSYLTTYRTHFEGFFGDMHLNEITQDVIQQYYNQKQLAGARKDKKDGGLSAKTIRNHHMLLKEFFNYAIRKYKLPDNPALGTSRPRVIVPETRVLRPEEMQIFIKEVMRETQRVAILTALCTGMRIGELLALEIADLDLQEQCIAVSKNLLRVNTEALSPNNPNIRILNYNPEKKTHLIVQSSPKTEESNRKIYISDALCELLIRHLFTLSKSTWPNPDNLLFPSTRGTRIDPKSFQIRLAAVSKRCEIQNVNPHALRHTMATWLVENTPISTVKDILGHTSILTTARYTHKDHELERHAIENMTNLIDLSKMNDVTKLNGTRFQPKFADIELPDFSQPQKKGAKRAM